MADIPPTVRAADILNALGSASIVDVPPAAPQTISASQVQSVVAANTIAVGDFTAKDRARAAVHLTYFVGGIISFVILMVFLDYLTHMPTTPDNLATHQPVQQASPAPALPSRRNTCDSTNNFHTKSSLFKDSGCTSDSGFAGGS